MKARIFACLVGLAALFSGGLRAQEGLKLGFVALPQTTWLLNNDDIDAALDEFTYKVTWGMAVGPEIGYNFNEHLGFRLDFLYSVQGQEYENLNAEDTWVHHTRRLHYLKVPLMFGFNTNTQFNKLIFSAHAGFQANFLIKARYYNDDESYTPDEALFDNITDYPSEYQQYSFLDYGPVADIGLDIKLTYNLLANIHLRADYSISDAENKNASFRETLQGITNQRLFYDSERAETNNLTGGIRLGLTWTIGAQ